MTQNIILAVVIVVFVLVAIEFVRHFLRENNEAVTAFINNTGYKESDDEVTKPVTARAKVADKQIRYEQGGFVVPNAGKYFCVSFELGDGQCMEFHVEERVYHRLWLGQTGTLRYDARRFHSFDVDDTAENLAKTFL
ncbi:MAG: DUF2500 family protein [Peptococcaceae bacterium]|nr:DUF2500 family protein [Peptococcaceae bacterium]